MRRFTRFSISFVVFICLVSLLSMPECQAAEPTLARLSFWVPPERMGAFEVAYREQALPVLKRYGLIASSELSRATTDSVFARLFEVQAPADVTGVQTALEGDSTWAETLQALGSTFGTSQRDGRIRYRFGLYSAPSGPGKLLTVEARATETQGTGRWRTYSTEDGLSGTQVLSIVQDREGNLWFGAWGGVSCYDGQVWTAFTARNGLPSNYVTDVLQDRAGYIWVATGALFPETGEGKGVGRYDGRTWTPVTAQDGLASDYVADILEDRAGNLWFGTDAGVSRYNGQTWKTFTTRDGLGHDEVWRMYEDRDGHLWFGTLGGGVSRYDGRTWKTFTTRDGLCGDTIRSIFQDREGNLWFGSENRGVSRYDGRTWTAFTPEDGLAGDIVFGILQDRDGAMWFGTFGGACRYDGRDWTTFKAGGKPDKNGVIGVFQDRNGDLWFCTGVGGVSRYDGKTWSTFQTEDGLAGNGNFSAIQDRRGHLWFGSFGGGVSRYDGQVFQTLTAEDGLAGNYVSVHGLFEDRDGNIWIGTTAGVTRFRPPPPSPPGIVIDGVMADRRYEGVSDLAVPSTVGVVTFEFHGKSLKTRPDGMVYRYRLNGFETDWRNTRARRVEYQGLPGGDYTFEVLAVDRDLVYSEAPATVALTVHLPYERIGWISALGIAFVLIAWQAVRLVQRNRELRASNVALSSANVAIREQTERKSAFLASMSHELRTPMNAIIGFTRMVLRRAGDALPDRQKDNLNRVVLSANHLLALINDLLDLSKVEAGRMDVDAEEFNARKLITGCCAQVEPLVMEKPDVKLTYDVTDDIGEANTDQGRLRQILMNLLSNAIKFTDKGEIAVRVSTANEQLVVEVSDTGAGIPPDALETIFEEFQQVKGSDPQHKGTGLGLPICKGFAELLGGSIRVESEVGKGSTFTLRIPMVYKES